MKVYLDDEPFGPEHASFGPALAAGVDEAQKRGRIVIRAVLDGRELGSKELDQPTAAGIDGSELHMETRPPRDVVLEAIADAQALLATLGDAQREAARAIQAGQVSEGVAGLGEVVSSWQAVQTVVEDSLRILQIPFTSLHLAEGPAQDWASSLSANLTELKRSLEIQDWSALADVLAYDLDEHPNRCDLVLQAIADAATGDQG